MKYKGDNIFVAGAKVGLAFGLSKEFKDTDELNKISDGFFLNLMGIQIIMTIQFYLGMVNIYCIYLN